MSEHAARAELPPATTPLPHHHPLRGRTADLLGKLERPGGGVGFAYDATVLQPTHTEARQQPPPEPARPEVLKLSGYRDQLRDLGTSLLADQYRSLTQLDLSRNALTSLKGLQQLRALRQLSLYYNMVSDLSEMERLQHHPELTVFDLRLNPVAARPHALPRPAPPHTPRRLAGLAPAARRRVLLAPL